MEPHVVLAVEESQRPEHIRQVASPGRAGAADQAEEVCKIIRDVLCDLYDEETAEGTTIQYGGSMNAGNAKELLGKYDVDGGLIGGASLKSEDFATIVKAAE